MRHYRIVEDDGIYLIQELRKTWIWFGRESWETVGDADWAAVFRAKAEAQRELDSWGGKDKWEGKVIAEKSIP